MIPSDDPLQRLRELNATSPQFYEQLSGLLHDNAWRNLLHHLRSESVVWLIEYLDSVSFYYSFFMTHPTPPPVQVLAGISDHAAPVFRECLHGLREICAIEEVLPKSCTLSESLLGCVYEGTFGGSRVRIRRIRMCPGRDSQKLREVCTQCCASLISDTHRPDRPFVKLP